MFDKQLLKVCSSAWDSMASFRATRKNCLDFSFGKQWNDETLLPDGRCISQETALRQQGKNPITNNLIRQIIKTIIGKWKYLTAMAETMPNNDNTEHYTISSALCNCRTHSALDARALEEFLISGCTAQRIDKTGVKNISPERIFLTQFTLPDASDARLIGMLHDLSLPELIRRFSFGINHRFQHLSHLFLKMQGRQINAINNNIPISFDKADAYATMRVIEVWHRQPQHILRIHDSENAKYSIRLCTPNAQNAIAKENKKRKFQKRPTLNLLNDIADIWQHTWLTSEGEILHTEWLPEEESPALILSYYPMLDGRVHSLVSDLIGQQKYINRLITLLDDVLQNSAKGVLLFPSDQLPEGITWGKMRELWSRPGAIIPFRRTSKNITPTEINTGGTHLGATEMLRTQLDILSRISGTPLSAINDHTNATSADMLRQQMENEMISILDILAAFNEFTNRRDSILNNNTTKGVKHG